MNDHLLDTLALAATVIGFIVMLARWHRAPDGFDLRDLIIDTKTAKVSVFKIGQLIALLSSTWVLIHETRAGNLTEWLFAGYMFTWAGANIANKAIDLKKEQTNAGS